MKKYILPFLTTVLISGCSDRYIEQNCAYFKVSEWSLVTEPSDELLQLSNIHKFNGSNRKEAWFKGHNGKLGLCSYTHQPGPSSFAKNCSSTYKVFIKEKDKWVVDSEAITLCHSE
ncbi:hypothetical protein KS2013_1602 [Kangiella sediminilitoris]|uniref:Lipoprotein n=1 Tax=Kangiella sediminilitoris TaxID=1144748 RepID=A0A1B3BBZ4_9GAMM|nr:hypothetical protein KS2013_1602 [Kangiella sediminilitoris]